MSFRQSQKRQPFGRPHGCREGVNRGAGERRMLRAGETGPAIENINAELPFSDADVQTIKKISMLPLPAARRDQ